MTRSATIVSLCILATCLWTSVVRGQSVTSSEDWRYALDAQLIDYYQSPEEFAGIAPVSPAPISASLSQAARDVVDAAIAQTKPRQMSDGDGDAASASTSPQSLAHQSFPFAAGWLRARMQQAAVLELAAAIESRDVARAKALRASLDLPRGVSAKEGALILQAIEAGAKTPDAPRILAREAITWQSTRVRQLFSEATRAVARTDLPMPGRLMEWLGETLALADPPEALKKIADFTTSPDDQLRAELLSTVAASPWTEASFALANLHAAVERNLPVLLSDAERQRRERLLLKLVRLVPKEYNAGVRDGKISFQLDYREAVAFTQQARQIVGELAPLWLADADLQRAKDLESLERWLEEAAVHIDAKADAQKVDHAIKAVDDLLQGPFAISLKRTGSTADIIDEVMLETRTLLSASLTAAMQGRWADAERIRVEAYTTYDPELEARLMPRDPQLARDIELLLLDGIDKPGVKSLLDDRASAEELQDAYARVYDGLDRATALLKSGISPGAAAMSSFSIILREGLEGLLVIVAILAGLRGGENKRRRQIIWLGILASLFATGLTWVLSQTVITSLRMYAEIIAAVTGILAIGVLVLITNWLFHQVYWRQWVTTLKSHAAGESPWQLFSVGFLIGFREGFEIVLFLQSLIIDAGGNAVGVGVAAGSIALIVLGFAVLKLGLKLPYFKILLITAALVGIVLIIFVGSTTRAAQTVGWLPVHKLMDGSWPMWLGTWFGIHNTVESVALQCSSVLLVLGTWRIARFRAKRKSRKRREGFAREEQTPQLAPASDPA